MPLLPGGVFDNALPDGRTGGDLVVHADRVEVVTPSGTFALSLRGLRVELGGADGDMVLLRGDVAGRVLFSDAPGVLDALRAHGDADVVAQCDRALAGAHRDRRHARLADDLRCRHKIAFTSRARCRSTSQEVGCSPSDPCATPPRSPPRRRWLSSTLTTLRATACAWG